MSLSWEPKREGDRYCSPACGRGCTWKEYQAATKAAAKLAEELGSDSWEPRVWENLGWHFEVISKNGWWVIEPYTYRGKEIGEVATIYSAGIRAHKGHVGLRWTGHGDTPEKAMEDAMKTAREDYEQIQAAFEGAEAWMNKGYVGEKCVRGSAS